MLASVEELHASGAGVGRDGELSSDDLTPDTSLLELLL